MLLVPLVSALEDRILSLGDAMPAELSVLVADVRQWVEIDDRSDPQPLRDRIAAVGAATPTDGWTHLLSHNLLARLSELVDLLVTARAISDSLTHPRTLPHDAQTLVASRLARPLHLDLGMAMLSTAATFVAVTATCAFWIARPGPKAISCR